MIPTLHDGPATGSPTVVLAHGAGAGMSHPFLTAVARGLAAAGLPVVRFDFPYRTAGKKVPGPMPVLQDALRTVVRQHATGPFVLAGKSMGGRVATMLADELGALRCVVFGYPFHPPGKPTQLRVAHLAALRTPTLILQGERDEFGTREQVAGYALSPAIEVAWYADGDHSLVPRKASGFTAAQHFAAAMERVRNFVVPAPDSNRA
ncbi:MAG: alpha/beta fold hydrolase [Planctomycetota bacterium]